DERFHAAVHGIDGGVRAAPSPRRAGSGGTDARLGIVHGSTTDGRDGRRGPARVARRRPSRIVSEAAGALRRLAVLLPGAHVSVHAPPARLALPPVHFRRRRASRGSAALLGTLRVPGVAGIG